MSSHEARSSLLRRALLANGVFSALSGLILIGAARPLAVFLGLTEPMILIGTGASLLVYAAALVRNARRETISRAEAFAAVALDAVWVAGSAVVILARPLTPAGNWIVAIVADVVFAFGILQLYGLRRMRQQIAG